MAYRPTHAAPIAHSSHLPPAGVLGRRAFLTALTAGTLTALVAYVESIRAVSVPIAGKPGDDIGAGAAAGLPAVAHPSPLLSPSPSPATATAQVLDLGKVPPGDFIEALPGQGTNIALTVDDGTNSAVVGAYLDFIRASGVRLTFFPNGSNPSWTEHAATLRPLIESGQVQIGNHTWSHPDLTRLSDLDVADEISRNESFFVNTFGVSGRPFLRPPYGAHNDRVDRIAADLGYPTIVMWWGSLGDSSVLTADQIMANAREWFLPQRIVIGHANHPGVTETFDQMLALLRERNLRTVTLNDVFTHAR